MIDTSPKLLSGDNKPWALQGTPKKQQRPNLLDNKTKLTATARREETDLTVNTTQGLTPIQNNFPSLHPLFFPTFYPAVLINSNLPFLGRTVRWLKPFVGRRENSHGLFHKPLLYGDLLFSCASHFQSSQPPSYPPKLPSPNNRLKAIQLSPLYSMHFIFSLFCTPSLTASAIGSSGRGGKWGGEVCIRGQIFWGVPMLWAVGVPHDLS